MLLTIYKKPWSIFYTIFGINISHFLIYFTRAGCLPVAQTETAGTAWSAPKRNWVRAIGFCGFWKKRVINYIAKNAYFLVLNKNWWIWNKSTQYKYTFHERPKIYTRKYKINHIRFSSTNIYVFIEVASDLNHTYMQSIYTWYTYI